MSLSLLMLILKCVQLKVRHFSQETLALTLFAWWSDLYTVCLYNDLPLCTDNLHFQLQSIVMLKVAESLFCPLCCYAQREWPYWNKLIKVTHLLVCVSISICCLCSFTFIWIPLTLNRLWQCMSVCVHKLGWIACAFAHYSCKMWFHMY